MKLIFFKTKTSFFFFLFERSIFIKQLWLLQIFLRYSHLKLIKSYDYFSFTQKNLKMCYYERALL